MSLTTDKELTAKTKELVIKLRKLCPQVGAEFINDCRILNEAADVLEKLLDENRYE